MWWNVVSTDKHKIAVSLLPQVFSQLCFSAALWELDLTSKVEPCKTGQFPFKMVQLVTLEWIEKTQQWAEEKNLKQKWGWRTTHPPRQQAPLFWFLIPPDLWSRSHPGRGGRRMPMTLFRQIVFISITSYHKFKPHITNSNLIMALGREDADDSFQTKESSFPSSSLCVSSSLMFFVLFRFPWTLHCSASTGSTS